MTDRDDLLILALNITPLMAYLLLIFITGEAIFATIFDAILLIGTFALLFQVRDDQSEGVLKFDENLTVSGVVLGIGLGLATFIGNVAVFSYSSPNTLLSEVGKQLSLVYIPGVLSVSGLPAYSLVIGVLSTILIAAAEEGLKASSIFGIFIPLTDAIGDDMQSTVFAVIVSAGVGIGEWALLHTIRAGFGELQVLMAFISGTIWFIGWLATGSILTSIVAHCEYDALVLALVAVSGSLALYFVIIITILTAASLGSYMYAKLREY